MLFRSKKNKAEIEEQNEKQKEMNAQLTELNQQLIETNIKRETYMRLFTSWIIPKTSALR